MSEAKFRDVLAERDKTQRALMKRYGEVREQYKDVSAKFPNSKKAAALKAELEACEKEFEQSRRETAEMIRARLRKPSEQKK